MKLSEMIELLEDSKKRYGDAEFSISLDLPNHDAVKSQGPWFVLPEPDGGPRPKMVYIQDSV